MKERAKQRESRAHQKQQPEPKDQQAERLAHFRQVGPTSIQGVEASDLPDKGRGSVETDFGKEAARKLPQKTGAIGDTEPVGLRGEPEVEEIEEHGRRGHN